MSSPWMSWFCLDSEIYNDPRIASLPDNDYRWVYITLLCLEKKGELEGQDVSLFSHHCQVTPSKLREVLSKLQERGLLDENMRPSRFHEWQSKALKRSRDARYNSQRRRDDATTTLPRRRDDVTSTTETETETETERKKKKDNARVRARASADEVLKHLRKVTGRNFSYSGNIFQCILREKCTVEDCKEIIDYKAVEWADRPEMLQHLDTVTPWRPSKFKAYLDQARAGSPDVREAARRRRIERLK